MIAEALTLARNFGPWFGGVALVAALAGGGAGFGVGKLVYQGRALTAERNLAQFEAKLGAESAKTERVVGEKLAANATALRERDDRITSRIDSIPAAVAAAIAPQMAEFRSALNAPEFDCLRVSLPEPALDQLRRPGGTASADPAADR